MDQAHLRNIVNNFLDVHLMSLSSWKNAQEIFPRDSGGPYVVLQEGYDPEDLTMTPDEFILGRSGKWLSLALFYRMPMKERREEFVFGTAAEVMVLLGNLPSKPSIMRSGAKDDTKQAPPEEDEMAKAMEAARQQKTH